MPDTKAERICARHEKKKQDRSTLDSFNDDIARLVYPERIGFQTDLAKGDGRTDDIYDSTPSQARWQLATSTEGYVTPKGGEPWLKIETEDDARMENHAVRLWFETVNNITFRSIYDPPAQFGKASGSMYNDLVAFGFGPIGTFERFTDFGPRPTFLSLHPKSFYWANNEFGEADTFFVEYERPVINAARLYGKDNLSRSAQQLLKDDKLDTPIKLLHYVGPRGNRIYGRDDNKNMPFESCVIEMQEKNQVEESGYLESPYAVPMWGEAGCDPWSPARLLLPDVKMLNQQQRTTLEVAHFSARPPLLMPHEGVVDFAAFQPGGHMTYDVQAAAANGGRVPITPLNTGVNYPISREITQETRDRIWQGFLRTILNLPIDAPQMTATEVIERKQEMMRTVGSTFGKLETDFSQKIVRRVFWILYRAGAFPPPPPELSGAPLKFTVNSPFTMVQKQIEAASVSRVMEIVGPLIQVQPAMLDNYDLDEIARDVGETMMPIQWVRSREAVEDMRAQRAEAERQVAQQQQAMQVSEMARNAAPMLKAIEGGAS